jgi:hypothetical protein
MRVLFLIFSLIFSVSGAFAQQRFTPGSPAAVVSQLYSVYKNTDFRKALEFTTGKEKEKVQKMLDAMNRNMGKPPREVTLFSRSIEDLKIIDEQIENQYARVDVIWILKHRDKKNPAEYLIKVQEIAYLLEKEKDRWMIRSSRFITEHVLYDRSKIEEIYKTARPFDQVSRENR